MKNADMSASEKRVTVEYDSSKTNPDTIATALNSAGCKATPLSPSDPPASW